LFGRFVGVSGYGLWGRVALTQATRSTHRFGAIQALGTLGFECFLGLLPPLF